MASDRIQRRIDLESAGTRPRQARPPGSAPDIGDAKDLLGEPVKDRAADHRRAWASYNPGLSRFVEGQ